MVRSQKKPLILSQGIVIDLHEIKLSLVSSHVLLINLIASIISLVNPVKAIIFNVIRTV